MSALYDPPRQRSAAATSTTRITYRVPDRVAINTLVVYALGLFVGLFTAYKLMPKFVRSLNESRIWPCVHHGRRRRGSQHRSSPLSGLLDDPRRIGRHRVVLLFLSSVLIVTDCISGFRYYYELWTTGWADTFLLNIIRLFTINLVAVFVMTATVYRTSLLIVTHPVHRKRVVWGMISLLCALQVLGTSSVAWVLWEHRHLDVATWQNLVVVPVWMAGFLLLVPLSMIVVSLWSLKVAFSTVEDSVGVTSFAPDTTLEVTHTSTSPSLSSSTVGSAESTASQREAPSAVASTSKRLSLPPEGSLLQPANVISGNVTASVQSSNGTQVISKRTKPKEKQRHSVMYSVGRSFKILTILLTLFWIFILFFIVTFRPFPIYSVSVVSLLCTLAIAVEAGFDWLIIINRTGAKQMIRRTLTASKAVITSKVVSVSVAVKSDAG